MNVSRHDCGREMRAMELMESPFVLSGDGLGVLVGQLFAVGLDPADVGGRQPRALADAGVRDAALVNRFEDPVLGLAEDRCGLLRGEARSEEHTSELQSRENLVCRLLLEKKKRETLVQ